MSWIESCGSTNDEVRKLAESGAPDLSWVASRVQTSGRGRDGRVWKSGPRNLYVSILFRSVPIRAWTWAGAIAALSVVEAVGDSRVKIKWPNDLWVGPAKLGGVLCEGTSRNRGGYLIVGLGLNVQRAPSDLEIQTVDLAKLGLNTTPEVIWEQIRVQMIDRFSRMGDPAQIRSLRCDVWSHSLFQEGDRVEWSSESSTETGLVLGLGEAGELLVRDGAGKTRGLTATDVSKMRPSN